MNEKYNYNLSGSDRKPLVEVISQILDQPVIYQGAPSFSYRVGDYTIDRNGVLSYDSAIHPDFAAVLVSDLRERGFMAERVAIDDPAEEPDAGESMTEESVAEESPVDTITESLTEETSTTEPIIEEFATKEDTVIETTVDETEPEEITTDKNLLGTISDGDTPNQLTIEIPNTGFTPEARANLEKIVASKAALLKQALETDDLPIIELDDKIAFPWFTLHGLDGEADAYSRLVTAICNMAKRQKRVTAVEKPIDNAKFTMRLFLIRLGFIGDEYKTARKILLRNLTGNSSWKSGHKPERDANTLTPPNPQETTLPTIPELVFPPEEIGSMSTEPQKEDEEGEFYGK